MTGLKTHLIIAFTFLITPLTTNAQTFQWAKDIVSEGFDESFDLATDPEGNTYVAGMIEFDTDFGNNVILHSAGIHDIFLAKYNPSGVLVWAKRAGGKGGDKIQSITLDGNGHIYVTGEFEDTCYWESIMKTTNGPDGVNNMFVAKYDTSGTVIWVRNINVAGPLQTRGYGVTCDLQGNVYACGGTKGDTYYNGILLFSTAGDYDGTIVKFDMNGNFCWARRLGGTDSDKAYGIASDNNGSIYVTGYTVGTVDFSSSLTLNGRGHTDIFLAKYDTAGTLQWAKLAGDTGFDRGWDVTINVNNEILITGEFQTGYFGPNIAHSRGNEDMFLASYNSNGDNNWVISCGGEEDDIGRGVSHDTAGNIYVIGDFASFGVFSPDTITSNGYSDFFLASYKSDGTALNWIRSAGGLGNDRGRGVGSDLTGNISVCGEFYDSIRFDNSNLIGDTLLDIFVSKVIQGNFCITQVSVTAENTCHGLCNGVAVATVTGQGPFIYNWSTTPAQSGITASGLCQGTYSITTTDAIGCTSTALFTISDPPLLIPAVTFINASCAGLCNGEATVTATGQGPFTYTWQTSPIQSDSIATGLCQGTYSAIVTDVAGCTSTIQVSLTDPPILSPTTFLTNSSCAGFCDGSITASANGQGPFTYNWLTIPPQSDSTITALCQGTYSVIITDVAGCTATSSAVLIDPLPIQINSAITHASCIGCYDGVIDVQVSGGTGTYQFLWSNGNTTEDLQSINAGNYNVCITDINNCLRCDTFTVLEPTSHVSDLNTPFIFSVFPNPFSTTATIRLNNPTGETTNFFLFNTNGQVVYQSEFTGNEFQLSAKDFVHGVYFIRLSNKLIDSGKMVPVFVNE
jgi:hypothetical protein